jgi:hypothetical protein
VNCITQIKRITSATAWPCDINQSTVTMRLDQAAFAIRIRSDLMNALAKSMSLRMIAARLPVSTRGKGKWYDYECGIAA